MYHALKTLITISILLILSNLAQAQKFYQAETLEEAQLKLYPVEDPKDAELLFSIIYDEKQITKVGIMMQVETPKEAQIIIIFVDDPADAAIKVWLVDTPEEVKWIDESKKKYLKIEGLGY